MIDFQDTQGFCSEHCGTSRDDLTNLANYSPDQERDDHGRFGSGSGELTSAEKSAVMTYRGETFQDINGALRAGELNLSPRLEDLKNNLDSAIAKSITTSDQVVYRGMDLRDYQVKDLGLDRPGTTFTDKAFMSTTEDAKVANDFGGTKIEIAIPKGSPALNVGSFSNYGSKQHEYEVLLPRNTSLEVISSTKNGYAYTIKARVVGT